MTTTDPTAAVTPGHPVQAGAGYDCACGECAAPTDPSTAQPATPGETLRRAADRLDAGLIGDGTNTYGVAAWLRRWADELDAAPAVPCGCRSADEHAKVTAAGLAAAAAPTTYALPAEPPPEVTELLDHAGYRWERPDCCGCWGRVGESDDPYWRGWSWSRLLGTRGPLSSVPPAGTEGGSDEA